MMTKFSAKHGLSLLVGIFLSAMAMASEPMPIKDKDAFEKQYIECFMSGLKDNCFISTFSGHLSPLVKDGEDTLIKVHNDTYLKNGISDFPILGVHPLDKTVRAEIFDGRTYLIENSKGNIWGLSVVFGRINGKWYLHSLYLSSSEAFIAKLLNMSAWFVMGAPIEHP
jgi:hypothetical protein